MIGNLRLPDPPPAMRERILSAARRGSARRWSSFAGLAAASLLLAGVLWAVLTNPAPSSHGPAQGPPAEEIRYKVVASKDGTLYTIELSEFRGGEAPVHRPTITVMSGRWASLQVGETSRGLVLPSLSDGETDSDPKLEERTLLDSGILVCFRGRPGRDGKINVDLRFYVVEKRHIDHSISESVTLASGEQRITKIP